MPRYVKVVKGDLPARYLIARAVAAKYSEGDSTEELLEEHALLLREEARLMEGIDSKGTGLSELSKPRRSLLDLKALIGSRIMASCCLCERRCHANRTGGEVGYCRLGAAMPVSSAFVHVGEEPEIVPSFTVYGMDRPN